MESRYNQWSVVRGEIAQQPVVGHGLGATFTYYEESVRKVVWSDLSHSIVLDLLFRMGIVGLVLFLAGIVLTANSGVLVWRMHADDRIAALGLAATAAIVGLLVRGQFESVFEKYRLAVVLGVLIGAVLSARTSYARQQGEALDRRPDRVSERV